MSFLENSDAFEFNSLRQYTISILILFLCIFFFILEKRIYTIIFIFVLGNEVWNYSWLTDDWKKQTQIFRCGMNFVNSLFLDFFKIIFYLFIHLTGIVLFG